MDWLQIDKEVCKVFLNETWIFCKISYIFWGQKKEYNFILYESSKKNIYFCFIDYANAFDFVDHNKL